MHGYRWPTLQVALTTVVLISTITASSQMVYSRGYSSPVQSQGSTGCLDDRCTLLAFKKQLPNQGEPALASWENSNASLWKGVTWKSGADGTVYAEKLELGGFELNVTGHRGESGLNGTGIAPLLREGLTKLTTLNISGNFLTAELPEPLRICPSLIVLDLSNNSFFGSLPRVFSCDDTLNSSTPLNLSPLTSINLQVLNLSRNNFSGEVPGSLFSPVLSAGNGGSLTNLTSLILDGNAFEGNIPSSLGNCTELVELKLSTNSFNRSFPFHALQQLRKLEIVEAMHNFITGSLQIPNDGGGFGQLKSLDLSYNSLTGHISESVGNLSNLQTLALKYNNLTGIIPKSLARLAKLENLVLNQNSLNGTIPEVFSQLTNLETLNLGNNKLTGSISPYLSNCTKLKSIWLGQNSIFGAIPPELGNLTDIVVFSVFGNFVNERIPVALGRSRNLVALDFSHNDMVGSVPDGLCDLFQMQVLLLNNNQLGDSIPACLGNYTYLRLLDLSSNSFSGNLLSDLSNLSSNVQSLSNAPSELSSASYIEQLAYFGEQELIYSFSESPISIFFYNNYLCGPIPTALGSIRKVQQLILANNLLSGPIPEVLGNASSLSYLDFSYNYLSGPIPAGFANLHFLSFLNLSFNNLSGAIPQEPQLLTFTALSFFGNPYLCGLPLVQSCSSLLHKPQSFSPTASPSLSHQSFVQSWVSFPAFGLGVGSFSLLSSFLFPYAYRSGKMAKAQKLCLKEKSHTAFSNIDYESGKHMHGSGLIEDPSLVLNGN